MWIFDYSAAMGDSIPRTASNNRLLVLLLCAGQFTAQFDRFLPSGALSYVKADLGLSDAALGLVQGTIFAVVYGVANLMFGLLGDPAMRRWLIAGGLALWSVGSLGCGLARSFAELVAARVVLAMGQAAFAPAALALIIAASAPSRVGRSISLFTAGSTLGRGFAVLAAGLMIAILAAWLPSAGVAVAPWRLMFAITALPNLALIIALYCLVRSHHSRGSTAQAASRSGLAAWIREHPGAFAGHFLASVAPILLIQSVAAWFPTLCARYHDIEPARAAVLVGGVTLVTAPLGQFLGGWLLDLRTEIRAAPGASIAAALAVAALALMAIPLVDNLGTTLAALAILNLALGVSSLIALAGLELIVPPIYRTRGIGLFFAVVTFVGVGFGPLLVGMFSDAKHAQPAGLAYALIMMASASLALGIAGATLGWGRYVPVTRSIHAMLSSDLDIGGTRTVRGMA